MKNFLIRLFLRNAIPFGLLFAVPIAALALLVEPRMVGAGIAIGLCTGFYFGAMMTGFFWVTTVRPARRRGGSDWNRILSPVQVKEFTLPADFGQAVLLAAEALYALTGQQQSPESVQNGLLRAKTGMSWQSFGDEITIRVENMEQGGTGITVTSTSLKNVPVDYGSNFQNVERLADQLRQSCRLRA